MGLLRGRPSCLGLGIPHLHLEEEAKVVSVQTVESPRACLSNDWLQAGLERLVLHAGEGLQHGETVGELLVLGFLAVDILDAAFDEQLVHRVLKVVGHFWDEGLQVEDLGLEVRDVGLNGRGARVSYQIVDELLPLLEEGRNGGEHCLGIVLELGPLALLVVTLFENCFDSMIMLAVI